MHVEELRVAFLGKAVDDELLIVPPVAVVTRATESPRQKRSMMV
jgi:hypothetical protein